MNHTTSWCTWCTTVHHATFTLGGLELNYMGLAQAIIQGVCMILLLVRLNQNYRLSYAAGRLPIHRLLNSERDGVSDPNKGSLSFDMVASPTFYLFCQASCVYFLIELVVFLSSTDNPIFDYIGFWIFAICAFMDNFVVLYLSFNCKKSATAAMFFSFLISAALLTYIYLDPQSCRCPWCGMHFPKPGIEVPYAIFTLWYSITAVFASRPSLAVPRPAAVIWCVFVALAYGCATIGLFLLRYTGADVGYCLINLGVVWYGAMYAPALAAVIRREAVHVTTHEGTPSSTVTQALLEHVSAGGGASLPPEVMCLLDDPSIRFLRPQEITYTKRIGIGGYGEVYAAHWGGLTVAVKRLFAFDTASSGSSSGSSGDSGQEALCTFIKEVHILSRLRHPNCVLFLGVCIDRGHEAIVTEYLARGSVYDLLHRRQADGGALPPLKLSLCDSLLLQCSRGVLYLHTFTPMILHRDLKSANLLLDDNMCVKVCDFGLSITKLGTMTMTAIGTVQWAAPELLRHEAYNEKTDVFAFGVLAWEVFTRRRPFDDLPLLRVAHDVAYEGLRLQVPPHVPQAYAELMAACWQQLPDDRPDFSEIVSLLSPPPVAPQQDVRQSVFADMKHS